MRLGVLFSVVVTEKGHSFDLVVERRRRVFFLLIRCGACVSLTLRKRSRGLVEGHGHCGLFKMWFGACFLSCDRVEGRLSSQI